MMCRQFLAFVLLLVLLSVSTDSQAELQDSRAELDKIKKRIASAQVNLSTKKQSEVKFSRQLVLLKSTLESLDKRISRLKKEQHQLQGKIKTQEQQINKSRQKIRLTGKRLEKRLVALYKEGEIGPLKVLFSANSPTELVQQYHYLTRIVEFDRELLGEYRTIIESQQQQTAQLEQLQRQQELSLKDEQQQRKIVTDGRRLQRRLLQQVKSEKKLLNRELAQLKKQAQQLQQLISHLQKQPQPVALTSTASFRSGKGKLLWPVRGNVLIGFGTKKDPALGTFYESNGIEIATKPDTPIRAVADGNVVFSDWFKGYGNLLILNHVGGYHTLYAQAARLDKAIGDQVTAGEVLARSGLDGRDSIYFEIRHNGSPVNPLSWLQRR